MVIITLIFISLYWFGLFSFFREVFKKNYDNLNQDYGQKDKDVVQASKQKSSAKLEQVINTYLKQHNIDSNSISIYISSADNKIEFTLNENKNFIAESLYNVPLAMVYYEKNSRNEIVLDDRLLYEPKHFDEEGPIGSNYEPGQYISIKELLNAMIRYSDNTAAHILYDNLRGWPEYKDAIKKYSLSNFSELFYSSENVTTTSYMNDVLDYIYKNKKIFAALIKDMKESMPDNYLNKSGFINIAQKYGSCGLASNAVGIYFDDNNSYKISILTSLGEVGEKYIGDISELCYGFFIEKSVNKINSNLKNENSNNDDKNNKTDENNKNDKNDLRHPQSKKVKIDLEQSIQENNYYCVPACVQMVLKLHGISVTQDQLAIEMHTSPSTGTEYIDLAQIVNKYVFKNINPSFGEPGYRVQTVKKNEDDETIYSLFEKRIREDIDTGDPIFVAIDTNALYPNISSANHMILVTGYTLYEGTNDIEYYYIVDPLYTVQDSVDKGLKIVAREALINAIVVNEEPAYIW